MKTRGLRGGLAKFVFTAAYFFPALALAQVVDVAPPSHNFPDQVVGTTSAPQLFTVTNSDAVNPLNVSAVILQTGTEFSIVSEDCTTSSPIAPLGTCSISVDFSPSAVASFSDNIQIDSDDPASPELVPLSGDGVQPEVTLTPTSLSFGNQLVGTTSATQSVTVENTGTSDLTVTLVDLAVGTEYAIATEDCTTSSPIAPSGTCTIDVEFSPTTTGLLTDDLQITSDAPTSVDTVPLDGTGIQPETQVTPGSLNFGSLAVGNSSVPQTVTVENIGTATLNIGTLALGTSDYSLVNDTCTGAAVLVGNTCTVDVVFNPTSAGPLPDTLSIPSDAPTSPDTVTLNGTGLNGPVAAASPATLNFGMQQVGTASSTLVAQLTNTGNQPLGITGPPTVVGSTDFAVVNETCTAAATLQPGEDCLAEVQFTPTTTGPAVGVTLEFATSISNPAVALAGTGIQGTIGAAPPSVSFTGVPVGTTSAASNVTITNTSATDDLHIGNLQQIGADVANFNIINDTCSNQTLAPSGTCDFDVTFTATSTALATDTVLIPNDSATPNFTVALDGTGVNSSLTVTGSGAFGSVSVGTTAGPTLITVTNTSAAADLQIGNLQQVGADTTHFAIVNDTCSNQTVPAGGANTCTFGVTFSPDAPVAFSGSVLIPNDSATPNATLALSGTGVQGTLVSSGNVIFPDTQVGVTAAAITVTLTNASATAVQVGNLQQVGANPTNFAILNDTCSAQVVASGGGTCTFDATFTPDAAASFSDSILIPNDSSTPNLTVGLSGDGVSGTLTSSGPLTFTGVPVGTTSAPQTVTLTNTSADADVLVGNLQQVGSSPANFTILNDTCSNQVIPAGGSNTCTFDVTFTPNTTSAVTDTVLVPNDSSTPNLTVGLSGTGDASAISVSSSGTFGTVPVGTTAGPTLITVTNTSTTADLQIGNLQQIGADPAVFSIQNDNCSNQIIPAGGSNTCTFEVTFSPADAVAYSDTVLIPNDSATPSATLALSGTGELGTLTDSGDVDFLNVPVGTTAGPVTVTLTNTSATAEVMIGNLQQIGTDTANFAVLNDTCSNQVVAPLGVCTFDVTFSPDAVAAFSDTVLIPNDSSTPNLTVDLDGAGVAPALSSSGNLTFTDVPVGTTSAPQTVTITNTSADAAVAIGELIRVGADTANFNIANDTCSNQVVAALGACSFDVTCTPGSTATFNDTVQIPSDDPASPLLVTLTCNGLDSGLSANTPLFPDTLIQSSSAPQVVTVSNGAAAAPAIIGTVSITGTDADNFHIVEDNCSNTTVAAGASCTISVGFDPDLVQSYSATLSIPSNAQSGPLNIPLAGAGVAPTLVVSPASPFDYGDVPINDPGLAGTQTFTLDNTSTDPSGDLTLGTISLVGSNPDQFTIVEDDCSNTVVSFGSNCTLEVAFLPTATGLQEAALSIPSNDPANPVLEHDIEGTGIASAVSVTPASPFDFLTVPVDTASAPQTFTVENTGTAPLALGQLALVGANPFNFAITADACSNTILAPAATCDYDVTFFPEDDVSYTATVSIPSNDPNSPFSYTVTGTGIIPGLVANPANLAFGNQDVGSSSAPQTVTFSNTGAADVTVANVSLVGTNLDDFEIVQDGCSGQALIPAGTCQVRGVFSPESAGAKSAALLVLSDDVDNPFLSVALTGTGIVPGAPLVSLAPTVLDFDNVEPNTTTIQNVTLTNTGTGTLTVSAVAVGGSNPQPFSNSGDCVGANLGAGQSCTEAVTFAPGTEENFNAVLNFTTNVPQQPSFVVLIGSSAVDNSGCALGGSSSQGGGKALGYGFLLLCLTLAGAHRRWARFR